MFKFSILSFAQRARHCSNLKVNLKKSKIHGKSIVNREISLNMEQKQN